MTFHEAAKHVLAEAGQPLRASEIVERALAKGLLSTAGGTPEATMRSVLGTAFRRDGSEAEVTRTGRGLWGLQTDTAPAGEAARQPRGAAPRRWLFATNPSIYDAEELFRRDRETWGEGLRGHLARKRIREEVAVGDTALVYRTRPAADVFCEITVLRGPFYHGNRPLLEVEPVRRFEPPVPLRALRGCPDLRDMEFLRNARVSVSPLSEDEYEAIIGLVGWQSEEPDGSGHDRAQWQLIALGQACGCEVWVAPDCRSRQFEGHTFSEHTLRELPRLGLDEETVNLIRGIDVLWLRGNHIFAAFEVEHTTSIYSGLLRLSDLIALQPNTNIRLFIVAPSARRVKVTAQLNRPTFHRFQTPLNRVCRFIPYDNLTEVSEVAARIGGYLQVEVLNRIAEECA